MLNHQVSWEGQIGIEIWYLILPADPPTNSGTIARQAGRNHRSIRCTDRVVPGRCHPPRRVEGVLPTIYILSNVFEAPTAQSSITRENGVGVFGVQRLQNIQKWVWPYVVVQEVLWHFLLWLRIQAKTLFWRMEKCHIQGHHHSMFTFGIAPICQCSHQRQHKQKRHFVRLLSHFCSNTCSLGQLQISMKSAMVLQLKNEEQSYWHPIWNTFGFSPNTLCNHRIFFVVSLTRCFHKSPIKLVELFLNHLITHLIDWILGCVVVWELHFEHGTLYPQWLSDCITFQRDFFLLPLNASVLSRLACGFLKSFRIAGIAVVW